MEDTLRDYIKMLKAVFLLVLILVLMEDTLRESSAKGFIINFGS